MESTLIVQHNILYSRGYQKVQRSEHYFPDHALGIMLAGDRSIIRLVAPLL